MFVYSCIAEARRSIRLGRHKYQGGAGICGKIMPPLSLSVKTGDGNWKEFGVLRPGNRPGSISDNTPEGRREVYVFACWPDDSRSVVSRSAGGADAATDDARRIISAGFEVVKVLRKGESQVLELHRTDAAGTGQAVAKRE